MQDRVNQKNSNAFSDTNKIEKIIDEIILKNKEKLNKIQEKEFELNIDRFSIKNKNGDTIFYIRKSSMKKTDDIKVSSGELLEKANVNPGEEALPKEKKIKEKIKSKIISNKFFFKKLLVKENNDNLKPKPAKKIIKPKFKFENLPVKGKNNGYLLKDNKLKKTSNKKEFKDNFKNLEEKTQKILEEHIKQQPSDLTGSPIKKKEKTNISNSHFGYFQKQDFKEEHVFFDEDSSFTEWSPNISNEEKKNLYETATPKLETDQTLVQIKDVEFPKEVLSDKSVTLSDLGLSEKQWEELDFYTLTEPFAYVLILRERNSLEKCYFLVEVQPTNEELETLHFIKETINTVLTDAEKLEISGNDECLVRSFNKIIEEFNIKVSKESKNKILYYLAKESLGLGKIDPLMKDPNIEDISCNGSDIPLFLYHRQFGSLKSNVSFNSENELSSFVLNLAKKCGKQISIAEPMLDATMPDGSHILMTLSDEITSRGSTFTIRKFRLDPFSPVDLIDFNTMSSEMIAYLWLAVENGINMLFAGGTASGKTTTLNAISLFIPPESKIVSIEETREINLPHPNWIPSVARTGFGQNVSEKVVGEIDMYDLMKVALRQRPEYILVSEIHGREAYLLFQAMATGHATYSTIHSDSLHSLIYKLGEEPISIPRMMLQSLDIITLQDVTCVKNKRARRCKQIIEIIDINPTTKEILTNKVFSWDPIEDKFIYSGKSYVLECIRTRWNISKEEFTQEIRQRAEILEWMLKKDVRNFKEVAKIISRYSRNSNDLLRQIGQKKSEDLLDNKPDNRKQYSKKEIEKPDKLKKSKNDELKKEEKAVEPHTENTDYKKKYAFKDTKKL